ncbi:MAG TPA: TetR/AcrR family transcriptional regulator [Pseudonocardiaceae bacterium]|jgi:AcrR family transcriptional regulator|nr:TetR/AcrR family transcriptional regulator [Pseudonocardiaceae bacterium]
MTGGQRRQQLMDVARELLAERGYDAASVEEIAHRAAVTRPVVYAHFGGKEGIYAVVVDREMRRVLERIEAALAVQAHPRVLLERAVRAFLTYVEECPDGFRILVRDSPVASTRTFSSLLSDIASQVEHILGVHFEHYGYEPKLAAVYAQMLVGMVGQTGQWWLDVRAPSREEVVGHVVNLAWSGLSHLDHRQYE